MMRPDRRAGDSGYRPALPSATPFLVALAGLCVATACTPALTGADRTAVSDASGMGTATGPGHASASAIAPGSAPAAATGADLGEGDRSAGARAEHPTSYATPGSDGAVGRQRSTVGETGGESASSANRATAGRGNGPPAPSATPRDALGAGARAAPVRASADVRRDVAGTTAGAAPDGTLPATATQAYEASTSATRFGGGTATIARRSSTATARPTATSEAAPDGPVDVVSPYLSCDRPFDVGAENSPSRYYSYGTTAAGEYLLHHGVDIGNPLGTPVRAVADGLVVYAGRDDEDAWGPEPDFYGQLVVLRHEGAMNGRPLYSLYGHVSRVLVEARQTVLAGQPIAEVGSEGIALGPHLHLEFRTSARDYEATLNPELILAPMPGTAVIAGRVLDAGGRPVAGAGVSLYTYEVDGPGQWLWGTTTYPGRHVNSAPGWGETFAFGDAPEGSYWIAADIGGVGVGRAITVTAGTALFVTLAPEP